MASSKLISPPGGATNIARRPAPIVLDRFVWIGGRMNRDTTSTVKSDDGHILEVSFWISEPPALSFFCIHCHSAPNSEPNAADFIDKPQIIAAEGRFALLHSSFVSSEGEDEYFMYKAGNGESGKLASSLDRLPDPGSLASFPVIMVITVSWLLSVLALTSCATTFTSTLLRMKHGQVNCCKIHALSSTRLE